jgi:hypothetical protein
VVRLLFLRLSFLLYGQLVVHINRLSLSLSLSLSERARSSIIDRIVRPLVNAMDLLRFVRRNV